MPIGILAAIAGFSAVVMLLWNALIPTIFGLAVINFWQALGLLVLSKILFGGMFPGRRHWGAMHRHHHGHGHEHFNPMREKWMNMTAEERKEFIKKRHFGHRFSDYDFGDDLLNDESKNENPRG
jgi:hypothetical protein